MSDKLGPISETAPYLLADIAEIAASAFDEPKEVTVTDLEGIIERGKTKKVEDEVEEEVEEQDDDKGGSAAINARYQKIAEDTFQHLQFRSKVFGEYYPFEVHKGVLSPKKSWSEKQKVYLLLLICSRLKCADEVQKLANLFEQISALALAKMYPQCDVYMFGANTSQRTSDFGTKLKDALRVLTAKLRDNPIDPAIDELEDTNTGDDGLDLVAIGKWKDAARGLIVAFGQCAAQQTGWPKKVLEAHPIKFKKYIDLFHPPSNIMFIPLCYRDASGAWFKNNTGHQSILVDRVRICELLESTTAKTITSETAFTKIFPGYTKKPKAKPAKSAKRAKAAKKTKKAKKK